MRTLTNTEKTRLGLKCESASRCFQPGECPNRGLRRDCENYADGSFAALVYSRSGTAIVPIYLPPPNLLFMFPRPAPARHQLHTCGRARQGSPPPPANQQQPAPGHGEILLLPPTVNQEVWTLGAKLICLKKQILRKSYWNNEIR